MELAPLEVARTEVLVLGGGLAGHRAAAEARRAGASVMQVFHGRGASQHVIGFNVPLGHADARDNPAAYFEDIIAGGYHLNDPRLVQALAEGAIPALRELDAIGVPFARTGDRYAQRLLSGNRYPRSVYHPDGIGRLAQEALAAHCEGAGVEALAGWKAIALLQDDDEVVGALLVKLNSGRLIAVHAGATVLAIGGIGAIYSDSTYPLDVAADGYALAWQVGATLIDMEFVQFEPTVVVEPSGCRGMEMPTAMLGDGASLTNALGERFMFRYNPQQGERGVEKARMALCIQQEVNAGRGFPDGTVVFDTTHVPRERLESYVSHCRRLRSAGLDPAKASPRVRPAAHSHMGGIDVDTACRTGVPGLLAAGESAGGAHGASRLAGNGASDVIVFGGIAGRSAFASRMAASERDWPRIHAAALAPLRTAADMRGDVSCAEVKSGVRDAMHVGAGLYRSRASLEMALDRLDALQREIDSGLAVGSLRDAVRALEAQNMVLTGRLIARSALVRTESRGAHQRTDHPERDDAHWLRHVALDRAHGFVPQTLPIR